MQTTEPRREDFSIEKGTARDIDELAELYDALIDHLEQGVNYPGWKKGLYPVRATAVRGVETNTLFVLRVNGVIAGSFLLNHEPEKAYISGKWTIDAENSEILVVHTLVVHPKYMKNGAGRQLMNFAKEYGAQQGMKAIRLDTFYHNYPAIALYEQCGFRYAGTVDLGLNIPHLVWFNLYEYNF